MTARGGKPNTEFLRSFDPSVITDVGRVKVLPTLQVPLANGKTNVFALGDIIDWDEQKMLVKVGGHVPVVVANVLSVVNGDKPTKEYKTDMEGIAVTVGRVSLAFTPNIFLGFLTRRVYRMVGMLIFQNCGASILARG